MYAYTARASREGTRMIEEPRLQSWAMTVSADRFPVASGVLGRAAGAALVAALTVLTAACGESGDTAGTPGSNGDVDSTAPPPESDSPDDAEGVPTPGSDASDSAAPGAGGLPGSDTTAGSGDVLGTDGADDAPASAQYGDIPDVEMIDVSSSATVNLRSLPDGERALLFWFWAPH